MHIIAKQLDIVEAFFCRKEGSEKIPLPYPRVDTKEPVALWLCFSMHDSCAISNSLRKGSAGTKSLSQNSNCCETLKLTPLDTQNKDLLCQLPKLDVSQCMEVLWKAHNFTVPTGNSWSYTELMAMVWSFIELWKHLQLQSLSRWCCKGWRNCCWMSGSLESSSVWCSCLCQILWETETKWYLCFQTLSPNQ